jgi:RNA 3'-phosphate cyclase
MIELDGSYASGGGQIVRTALALSTYTGKPFHIINIRKGKDDSGLKRQHVEAIQVLKKLCNATAQGDVLGSTELTFTPGTFKPQKLEVDIETAGSITLLLQSLLVPMVFAKKKTTLILKGGTDVQWSMPADYFKYVFLPHLRKFADVTFKIIKRGYYPKGNGLIEISISPKSNNQEILLTKQEQLLNIKGIVNASTSLQKRLVAERIAQEATMNLQKLKCPVSIDIQYNDSLSDGTGIVLWSVHGTEEVDSNNPIILGADKFGEIHLPAEKVAKYAVHELEEELTSGAAVDKHCADNLIPFLGVVGGTIKTSAITQHIKANIYVTEQFLDVTFSVDETTKEISRKQ